MRRLLLPTLVSVLLVACSANPPPADESASTSDLDAMQAQADAAVAQVEAVADGAQPAATAPAQAQAQAGWLSSEACSYLPALATRGWKNDYDAEYSCSSPYKDIGADGPTGLPNNLAYYANGTGETASQLKLVLNYNVPGNPAAATRELVTNAKALAKRATGADLPADVEAALKAGKASSTDAEGYHHEVKRDDWPTGNGYEIHYILSRAG